MLSFATPPHGRFTVIISGRCECVISLLKLHSFQLISCATLSKTHKPCLISDNSSTTTLASDGKQDPLQQSRSNQGVCLLARGRRAQVKPVSVLMIHPNPIMCLRLEFANIATHSQLLTLLFHLCLSVCSSERSPGR